MRVVPTARPMLAALVAALVLGACAGPSDEAAPRDPAPALDVGAAVDALLGSPFRYTGGTTAGAGDESALGISMRGEVDPSSGASFAGRYFEEANLAPGDVSRDVVQEVRVRAEAVFVRSAGADSSDACWLDYTRLVEEKVVEHLRETEIVRLLGGVEPDPDGPASSVEASALVPLSDLLAVVTGAIGAVDIDAAPEIDEPVPVVLRVADEEVSALVVDLAAVADLASDAGVDVRAAARGWLGADQLAALGTLTISFDPVSLEVDAPAPGPEEIFGPGGACPESRVGDGLGP